MTPTERAILQRALVDGARATPKGKPTNTALGNTMGCDRSEVSRFEGGTRRMDVDEIVALCEDDDLGGAAAILAPLAARFGLRLVPDVAGDAELAPRAPAAADLSARVAHLTVDILDAERDGKIDVRERRALAESLGAIAQRVAVLRAGLAS